MSTDEQKEDVVERLQRGVQEYEVRWAKHDAPIRHWDIGGADDAMREAATTITALQERIKELEVALRPFAKLGEQVERDYPDYADHILLFFHLTHGDFRRSIATLKDSGNGSEVAR